MAPEDGSPTPPNVISSIKGSDISPKDPSHAPNMARTYETELATSEASKEVQSGFIREKVSQATDLASLRDSLTTLPFAIPQDSPTANTYDAKYFQSAF